MTELRWILLGAGVLMLAGLYLWGTRARRRSAAPDVEHPTRIESAPLAPSLPVAPVAPAAMPPASARVEPQVHLDDERPPALGHATPRREPTFTRDIEPEVPAPEEPTIDETPATRSQRIVAVRVTARPPERFEGSRLHEAVLAEGMEFGRYGIFHRLDPSGRPIFSMASLVEPGTFDPRTMSGDVYPGIALFAVLPGPVPAQQAFEELVATAHSLAGRLGGGLQDDRGVSLSMQRVATLREEMLDFDRAHHAHPGH